MRPNSESSVAVPGDRGKCPCTLECPSPGFHSLLLLFLLSASVTFTAIGSVPVWHCTALLPLLPLLPCSFLSVTYLSDKWCVCLSVCACPPSLLVLLSHWWWSDGDDQVTRVTLARTCASSPHFFFFCFLHRGSFRFCTARHPFRGMCRSA